MKNLLLICVLGFTFTMGACAHKHGGCKDGSCKMEKSEKKDCDCGHGHDHKGAAEPAKTEEKK